MGIKGHKERKWHNQWHLSHYTTSYFSFHHVLLFCRPPQALNCPLPSFPDLFLSSYRFLTCSSLFDTFWHRLHSNFGQKRAQKEADGEKKAGGVGDRWRESEKMGGGGKSNRLFLAAGPSYFILLYNWYSFYITKTAAPLTLNLSCISGPCFSTLLLLPGSCFLVLLVFYVDSVAEAVVTAVLW